MVIRSRPVSSYYQVLMLVRINLKRPLVKICGLQERANILAVSALHPNYLGFVFVPQSPRYFSPDRYPLLLELKDLFKVGVFVNEPLDSLVQIAKVCDLNALQLHGDESEYYLEQVSRVLPHVQLIKAFRISLDFDFSLLDTYRSNNYFLFDTYKAGVAGGTGLAFDWSILQGYTLQTPYFLSGGLGLDNLDEALRLVEADERLHALDFNSALESAPGIKDIGKLALVMEKLSE
jgi:phosphoribosylanthranilate isomerase